MRFLAVFGSSTGTNTSGSWPPCAGSSAAGSITTSSGSSTVTGHSNAADQNRANALGSAASTTRCTRRVGISYGRRPARSRQPRSAERSRVRRGLERSSSPDVLRRSTPALDTLTAMCRNITTLRGLEPAATPEEIEAAARQYARKVSGVQSTSARTSEAFEQAVVRIAEATTELLAELPPRQQPPPKLPPLRRIAARSA